MSEVMPLFEDLKWDDNPCGFDLSEDELDVAIADDILMKDIITYGKLLLDKTVESRRIMKKTFQEVDEDSLEFQEYTFLNVEINVRTVFKDSYFCMQICSRAMTLLIEEIDNDEEKQYYEATKNVRDQMTSILCTLQVSLIGKEKHDISKIYIPTYLINPEKYTKHVRDAIFLRQIEENIKKILDAFGKYKENALSL